MEFSQPFPHVPLSNSPTDSLPGAPLVSYPEPLTPLLQDLEAMIDIVSGSGRRMSNISSDLRRLPSSISYTVTITPHYAEGLTPISSMTPTSSNRGNKASSALNKGEEPATTTPINKKTNDIPRALFHAFDKRFMKATRTSGIECDSEAMETMDAQSPSKMTQEQRQLVQAASKTVKTTTLRTFLRMDYGTFKDTIRRNSKMGRPSHISSDGLSRVHEAVTEAENSKKSLTRKEVYDLLTEEAATEAKGKNRPVPDPVQFSDQLCKLAKKAGIEFRKGQATTVARWFAERDIRNMVSMVSLLHIYKGNPPELLGNLDATQVSIEFNSAAELATTGASKDNGIPLSRVGTNKLGVSIKQFTLVSASGHISLTLLLSEPTLGEDDFVHFPVPGLSLSIGDPSFTTEVCFCKTRTGTRSFFEYMFMTVVIDFVTKVRALAPTASREFPFLLIIDGEAIQSEVLQRQNVLDILVNNNIQIGKGPASTSGACGNPLDMGNFFKSQKTLARSATDIMGQYPALKERILDCIKIHSTSGKLSTMGSERKSKAAEALIRTVKSCDDLHNIPSIISKGFKLLGLYPYNPQTTINCCAVVIPEEEQKLILDAIPQLSLLMNAHGQVTEAQMDAVNIPRTKDEQTEPTAKDQRPQERQRAIILTHDTSLARRREYIEEKQKEREEVVRKKNEREQDRINREKEKEDKKLKAAEKKKEKTKAKEAKIEETKQKRIDAALAKEHRLEEEQKKKEKEKEEKKEKEIINNKRKDKPTVKNIKNKRQAMGENNSDVPSSSSSVVVIDPLAVPDDIDPFMDFIFAMVAKSNGTFKHHAVATSIDSLKTLLRNENREYSVELSSRDVKSTLFWDHECYEINIQNRPRLYSVPGPVLNPFATMSSKDEKWLQDKTMNEPNRISNWLPGGHKKFLSPIPCFSSDDFNHVERTSHFRPNESQVVKNLPRVCLSHVDHGFGWLYGVDGVKIIIFIKEVEREPGSMTNFVRGCPVGDTWDFDVLSQSSNAKYFILQPGSLMVIPANIKHIVISPQNSLAYGSFISHVYSAVSDFAHYLDIHREINPDFTTINDASHGIGISETNKLATQIIKSIEIDRNWNKQKFSEIVQAKRTSLISNDRQLTVKINKICSLSK